MTEIKPLQKVQMVTFSKIYVYSSERLICYQEYNQTTPISSKNEERGIFQFFDQKLKLFKYLSRLSPDLQTRVMFLATKRILQPMHINVKFLILYQCDEYTIWEKLTVR